jgi:3-hydroxyisobutyrate dehydrogenase-like beta-hydroxyacid dehydrogenase
MAKKIGFLGLDNMGEHMAVNSAKAGFDFTV